MNATWASKETRGFTLVELLIVIVVIAILAAISVVVYSGVRDRAEYSKVSNDLASINRAIQLHHAAQGTYPVRLNYVNSCANEAGFMGMFTDITSNIPSASCSGPNSGDDAWAYRSDGVGYKLIYIRPAYSQAVKDMVPSERQDPARNYVIQGAWGYWTQDHANL